MRSTTDFRFMTLCLLLGTFVNTPAAEYEVDGHIEQTFFNINGGTQSVTQSQFTVYVRDCSWLIQSTVQKDAGQPPFVNESGSIDGSVFYSVGKNPVEGSTGNRLLTRNYATIFSNTAPVGSTGSYFVGHLWLMFASGCYFSGITNGELIPVYDSNASVVYNPALRRVAKWQLLGGPVSLPSSVTYLNGPGNTNATYTVSGVTNVGGQTWPSGFLFEERVDRKYAYGPGQIAPGQTNSTYRIRRMAVATVTDIRLSCSRKNLMPTADGMTHVIDERVATATNGTAQLTYTFPDRLRWVSVEEAKKLVAAQTRPTTPSSGPIAVQRPPTNPVSKSLVLVILLTPAAVVLLLWLLSRSKGQNGTRPPEV